MSQIKLKHSGGNSVIIAAPDSNPASDRTLKLPSDGDGTILTTNSATGKILQVVQTYKTDTFSESLATGAESGDVTGLTASITPSNASNKILISFDLNMGLSNSSNGSRVAATIYKAGSILTGSIGDASGDTKRVTSMAATDNLEKSVMIGGSYIDTAGGTSSITYSLRLRHGRGATCDVYINRPATMYNFTYGHKCGSSITLMEVAA